MRGHIKVQIYSKMTIKPNSPLNYALRDKKTQKLKKCFEENNYLRGRFKPK